MRNEKYVPLFHNTRSRYFYYYVCLKIDITVLDGPMLCEFCMLLFLYIVRQVCAAGENSLPTYSIPGVLMYNPTYTILMVVPTPTALVRRYTQHAHTTKASRYITNP